MAKHNKKGRSKYGPAHRHVRLYHWLLDCPAWQSLTPHARAIYVELARRYYGGNNGEIALSQREAARACKMATPTAARALRELKDKGFIAIQTPGAFHYKVRHATEYRLTEFECNGVAATKDFIRWRPQDLKPGPKSGSRRASSGTEAPKNADSSASSVTDPRP